MELLDITKIKNIHDDKVGILFGSGPTVTEFNYQDSIHRDVIKFGINECIYLPFDLDYIAVGDHRGPRPASCVDTINKSLDKVTRIVTGYEDKHNRGPLSKIENGLFCPVIKRKSHLSQIEKFHNKINQLFDKRTYGFIDTSAIDSVSVVARKNKDDKSTIRDFEKTTNNIEEFANIHTENFRVVRYGSVSFDILQLMVWMGFEKIILIGHDTSYAKGTFRSHKEREKTPAIKLLDHWKGFHDYLGTYFPKVQIKVLRPVALKEVLFPLFETIDEETLKKIIKKTKI